jgi:protein O-GlcNAc transferase
MPDHSDAIHLLGVIAYQRGRPEMALQMIERAIEQNGDDPSYYVSRGLALHHLKRLDESIVSYERALLLKPNFPEALFNLGDVLRELGRSAEARASYDRALVLQPEFPEVFLSRGDTLGNSGHLEEAVANYDRALALKPNYPEASLNRGVALERLQRFDQAVESYDQALTARPHFFEAHYNRGNSLQQLNYPDEALQSYDRALAVKPGHVAALTNRGVVLRRLARLEEALDSYERALTIMPDCAEALNNRGLVLKELGRLDEAHQNIDRALAIKPDYADALNNRGLVLQELARFGEALEDYDRALAIKPDHAGALTNRGIVLWELARFDEALASYERALAVGSHLDAVAATWFDAKRQLCDWSGYHEGEERARNSITTFPLLGMEFKLLALSSTPEEQFDCTRRIAAEIAVPKSAMLTLPQPRPGERIRLGYLSADYYQHATAFLIAGLIERHNRSDFEVVGYSYGPTKEDNMRARLSAGFDRFVDVGKMSYRQAAEAIRADAIDILIDLKGFTRDCRPAILAYRPAPIQVNYLGYPGTMGADFIDYIIVDPFVVPPEQQAFFSERLVHLPQCYQCNDATREIADRTPSRAECGLPEQGFVFCCFNNSYKITPAFFDIWMRLLHAVPRSVLWLLDSNPRARSNLMREASARGIAPERLIFAPRRPLPEHLARHRLADLFLDTLPYNAHTTASDALWAGLPLLTCTGHTFAGRVAGSLLQAVGLGELVTTSLKDYEALALRLARDRELLGGLHVRLAQNRPTSPLFDTERFARNLEIAYRRMWEKWSAGHPSAAFGFPSAAEITDRRR